MQNLELKAGRLVVFSCGEYSDYGYRGSYVALVDVSDAEMRELADQVNREANRINEETDDYARAVEMFEAEMIRKGWIAIIEMREIHIGSYSELEL